MNKPEVIAFEVTPSRQYGGMEHSLFDVCHGLAARSWSVTLLHHENGDMIPEYQTFARTIQCDMGPLRLSHPWEDYLRLRAIRKELGCKRARIVYVNSHMHASVGAALAFLLGAPFVCHLRLPAPRHLSRQFYWGLRRADRLIAISRYTKRQWAKRGLAPRQIDVVYNGIDGRQFQPRPRDDVMAAQLGVGGEDFVIAYIGRIVPQKGIDLVFRAVQLLHRRGITARFLVAGTDTDTIGDVYLHELQVLARGLDLGSAIRLLGHVGDVPKLLSIADVLVLPTRSSFQEPFGRVLIEAMSCGVPALGTRVGGIPEVLGAPFRHHLVEPDNATALADKLESLAGWRHRQPDLGAQCRAYILENFSLERTLNGVHRILRSLAAR